MQHVSTYNSHLQAKLRIVIALQGGCAHLGSHMAYRVFAAVFFIHNATYIYCAIVSRVKCVAWAKLLVSVVLLLLELSVGMGWGGGFRPLVLLYVSAFCLWGGCASFVCYCESHIGSQMCTTTL